MPDLMLKKSFRLRVLQKFSWEKSNFAAVNLSIENGSQSALYGSDKILLSLNESE